MKMAKANERDMEAALAVCRIIDALDDGLLPDDMTDGDDLVWFEDKHAAKVVEHLLKAIKGASLFRVCFGMTVLLDPSNEIVDPEAHALELHPKHQRNAEEVETLKATVIALLDILRNWEPDHASGEERHQIVQAMYQVGILHDPTKIIEAMNVACETAEVRP